MGGQRHALARDPVPIYRRLGGAAGPVWTCAENLVPTETRSPDCPARSESLYRLSHPGTSTSYVHCLSCLILYFLIFLFVWSLKCSLPSSFTKYFRSESVEWSYFSSSWGKDVLSRRYKRTSSSVEFETRLKSYGTIQSIIMYETNLAYVKIPHGG